MLSTISRALALALLLGAFSGCAGSSAIGECGDANHPASSKDPVTGEPCSKVFAKRKREAPEAARTEQTMKVAEELADPNSHLHKLMMRAGRHLPAGASMGEIEEQAEREAAGR